jgi:cytochrome c
MAGFPYSDALKKSGLVWTEDNLRKWIADSAHTVPNTLMPHVSISDPAEQIYLVAYLKTLKAPAAR